MMMKADLALYRAKNEGRNQFRFHVVELDEQTQERIIIGEELRHAIERDNWNCIISRRWSLSPDRRRAGGADPLESSKTRPDVAGRLHSDRGKVCCAPKVRHGI